jgi:hypothetical protein
MEEQRQGPSVIIAAVLNCIVQLERRMITHMLENVTTLHDPGTVDLTLMLMLAGFILSRSHKTALMIFTSGSTSLQILSQMKNITAAALE